MNPEELRVLIKYHAETLAKWIQEPHLASKFVLAFHAKRAYELIEKLPEKD